MTSETGGSRVPSITVRPTAEEKRLFSELAARRGVSESKLALAAVRTLLRTECLAVPSIEPAPQFHDPGTDRITIRLRPGDLRAIAARAEIRRTKPSTYLAALVRAHVASNPPLTADELRAFKLAVTVLAGYGRLLALQAKGQGAQGSASRDLQQDLSRTRCLVATIEQRLHDFVRASLDSWESRHG